MALGEFTISRDGRARLAVVLRALLIAQLVISLCMVIFCYNASVKVMLLLKDIHKATVLILYGLILVQAYGMKLHYTTGLRLLTWLTKYPYWPRTAKQSKVWVISGSLLAANGLLVYEACNSTLKDLCNELSSSLRIGISQYLSEPTWKKLLDTMQIELNCCGAESAGDWHTVPWINMDVLNESCDLVMRLAGSDGKMLPPVTPYSCCNPRVLAPCYHDPLQQPDWQSSWGGVDASLNARSCVDAVRAPLGKALCALQWFNVLVFFFQMLIVLLSQLLASSARHAALRGDVGCTARAQLYPRRAVRAIVQRSCVSRPRPQHRARRPRRPRADPQRYSALME